MGFRCKMIKNILIDENGDLILNVPEDTKIIEIKNIIEKIKTSKIEVIFNEKISMEQMQLIWVLCSELSFFTGYTREEIRELLQEQFCYLNQLDNFSISPSKKHCCSKNTAMEFIQYIIEWSISQGYNLIIPEGKGARRVYKRITEVVPEIQRYVIACLRSKVCAICGRTDVDLHHWDSVAGISGYSNDDGLQTRFISLCREHHSLFHSIGAVEFEKRYHVKGVWLTPSIVSDLKKIYKNHFKNFKGK